MRKYEKIEVKQTKAVEINCNICGKDMITKCSKDGNGAHFIYSAGYDANFFSDGDEVEIDICEECLYNMIKNFKLQPEIENYKYQ